MTDLQAIRERAERYLAEWEYQGSKVQEPTQVLVARDLIAALDREKVLENAVESYKANLDVRDIHVQNLEAQLAVAHRLIRDILEAHDSGNLEMNSPEIGGGDIPIHPWHEEWLHLARAAFPASAPKGEK